MRFLLKMMILPLIVAVSILHGCMHLLTKLSCYVLGPLMWFLFGCGIYTGVHRFWSQTFLLALLEGACFLALFGAGFVIVTLEQWHQALRFFFIPDGEKIIV